MSVFPGRKSSLAIAVGLTLLAGCGGAEKSGEKPASQVAAKVNKEEISVHQINYVLSRSGNLPADQVQAASKQILEKLIDQNLLYQKALAGKLDSDTNVMQAVENTRRQVIAQAYLDKVMSAVSKPTPEEIRDYYAQHPELFSQRRLYRFQQISIGGGREVATEVQKELTAGKSLADISTWAQGKSLRVANSTVVKAAEQLPLELLPKLHAMKNGQIGVIGEKDGVAVLQLVASQDQPVSEQAATATIVQYLTNRRRTELADAEIKRLKAEAKIEYVGDFAKKEGPAVASQPAAAPTSPAEATATTQADTVSKAISGL